MAEFTPKDLEEFFKVWNDVVHHKEAPQPLNFEGLCQRLKLPAGTGRVTSEVLLKMADAVLALPPDTDELPLIEASYYWLVQQREPWAIKKNKASR